jgi:tetratricopeptide (TPR) repeat protein
MYSSKKLFTNLKNVFIILSVLQGCSFITEDPTNILLRQAKDFEYQGKFTEAEAAYKKVYEVNGNIANPMRLSILINQARFYLRTKDYQKAVSTCEDGLKYCREVYGPNDMLNVSFLFVLAAAYDKLQDYDKALIAYKRVIALAQFSPCTVDFVSVLPLTKMGDIEFKRYNLDKAFKLYEQAYATGHVSEMIARFISYRLARCSLAMGHSDQAENYFKNALPYEPALAAPKDIYIRYAKLLTKNNKFASAGLAMQNSEDWGKRHKEYVDWYYARTNPGSRCRLLDKYTEEDYDLADALEKNYTSEKDDSIKQVGHRTWR